MTARDTLRAITATAALGVATALAWISRRFAWGSYRCAGLAERLSRRRA